MQLFNSNVIVALKKALDAGTLRQRVMANNIANINTPGFKKSVVSFEGHLKAAFAGPPGIALKTSVPGHFSSAPSLEELQPQVVRVNDTTMRSDNNNVDIDQEMVRVAVNAINYNITGQALKEQYDVIEYVIAGRRP